jgi:hypothetical protein
MTERVLQYGDVVTVAFPEQVPQAREQEGYRPAIIPKDWVYRDLIWSLLCQSLHIGECLGR